MKMRWSVSLPAMVALSVLLSGCLVSKTPLITAANSDHPLPARFSVSHGDSRENSEPAELTGDNAYVFTDRDGTSETVRFRKIADSLYAASRPMIVRSTGELMGYQYGYMRVLSADGSKVFIHWPDCKAFEASDIEKLGVKIEKENDESAPECHVPSIEVLGTLIQHYISDPKNVDTIKSREEDGTFIIVAK
jgi:hypothetical protein